jgi:hypothetical protein
LLRSIPQRQSSLAFRITYNNWNFRPVAPRRDTSPAQGNNRKKVLAERGSGRLLGGQIVGMEGSAKRIAPLATALHAGFTVEEMINLDLGYAPSLSPVWDPVVTAAREAAKKL